MTTKGQVTIPKHIRDHLGIVPGSEVEFVREPSGVKFVSVDGQLSAEERGQRFTRALDRMRGTIDPGGMTTDEYIAFLRGAA